MYHEILNLITRCYFETGHRPRAVLVSLRDFPALAEEMHARSKHGAARGFPDHVLDYENVALFFTQAAITDPIAIWSSPGDFEALMAAEERSRI